MLGETRLSLVRVAWISELQLPAGPNAGLDARLLGPAFTLDTDHLRLLGDANLGAGSEMDKDRDTAGETALGIRNGGWIVGDEETELELWVMVKDVIVLQARCRRIVIGCLLSEWQNSHSQTCRSSPMIPNFSQIPTPSPLRDFNFCTYP